MRKNNHKFIAASILALILMASLVGCQEKKVDLTEKKMEHTTLVVKEDGTYQSAVISSFEEDYYSVDRLTSYVQNQIKEYKDEHPEANIELIRVEEKDKKASVIMAYTSLGDYSGFNDVEANQGTVQQLMSMEGWASEFTSAKKGSSVSSSELKGEDKAIMVKPQIEATDVAIEGQILYVAGGILLDDNTVQIESGTTGCIVYK